MVSPSHERLVGAAAPPDCRIPISAQRKPEQAQLGGRRGGRVRRHGGFADQAEVVPQVSPGTIRTPCAERPFVRGRVALTDEVGQWVAIAWGTVIAAAGEDVVACVPVGPG